MGYTHYWKNSRKIGASAWEAICARVPLVLGAARDEGIELGAWDGRGGDVEIGPDAISFNGVGDGSYESCVIRRDREEFAFCKTARKLYDAVVCAVLVVCAMQSPTSFRISSDGVREDFDAGLGLLRRAGLLHGGADEGAILDRVFRGIETAAEREERCRARVARMGAESADRLRKAGL